MLLKTLRVLFSCRKLFLFFLKMVLENRFQFSFSVSSENFKKYDGLKLIEFLFFFLEIQKTLENYKSYFYNLYTI